jgi:DNA-binding response OmpR family regulator
MNADGELRILVADDEPSMLDIMVRRLLKMGITPDTATDGAQAQALIEANDYDVIVSDIYMPEVTGLELLTIAKGRDPNVQVVIATASATIDNAVDALNNGAFGYLTKPFDHLSVFDKIVTRAMEFRRLLLDNERMAEVQRRRGDMLEEEVTQRIRQLRDRQRDLLNLLTSLPLGVAVVEEGGRVVMSNPLAEKWLEGEKDSPDKPIRDFMNSVHDTDSEPSLEVVIDRRVVRLTAVDILHGTPKKQKVVIIGEMDQQEEEGISHGTMVEDAIGRLHEGLIWLASQPLHGKANNVSRGLVKEIVGLGRMMGLEIDDPVLPEVEPEPILEPIFEEEPENAEARIDEDEDNEWLLAALQAPSKPEVISEPEPAPQRRRELPPAGEPISRPVPPAKQQEAAHKPRQPERATEIEGAGAPKNPKPAAERPPAKAEAPPPPRAKEATPIAVKQADKLARPEPGTPAREQPQVKADKPALERAKPELERPDADQGGTEAEHPAARPPKPAAKQEKRAPAFKSRLLQRAKELETGGWRPNADAAPKSGTNGDSPQEEVHQPEAPDNSVLSRLAQVTEDAPKSRPAARVEPPHTPRPAPKPTPQEEPVIDKERVGWAPYEESDTGSTPSGRGKATWPPPLPSAAEEEEEETSTEF